MAGWGITSESQARAQAVYDKENTVRVSLKLNIRTDDDIIQWLRGQKSMQGSIKRLVRREIAEALSCGDELFIRESEMIKEIANKKSCVIIGRCADYILRNRENVIRIFIYGNMEDKIRRAVTYYGLDTKKADKAIRKNDRDRALHYKHYTNQEWADKANYDICINSGLLGVEETADIICQMILGNIYTDAEKR